MTITTKSGKAKGTRLEKWVAGALSDLGVEAGKQPGSGIYSDFPHDVRAVIAGRRFIVECKARKEAPRTFERWLAGADLLVIRADRADPCVYMRWPVFAELVHASKPEDMPNDVAALRKLLAQECKMHTETIHAKNRYKAELDDLKKEALGDEQP